MRVKRFYMRVKLVNLNDGANTEVLVEDKGNGEKGGGTTDQVSTARPEVCTVTPSTPPTTTTIVDVEEPPRLTRLTTTLQPLPTIDPRDKGKGVLVEEEPKKLEKVKRRDQGLSQIKSDAELAQRIYAEELTELDRAQKERQKQEEATIAALTEEFDEIQARMDVDHELALKHKNIEELQKRYQKEQKWIDDFVLIDSEKEEKKSVEPKKSAKNVEEESADYEHEKEELRMWLTVVSDKEEIIDLEILSTKYPIVDWESQILGNVDTKDVHVYNIIKANENTSSQKSLSSMLRKIDGQDLVDLHRLVMKRFEDNTLEGYNLLLWGDLKSSYITDRWYFELPQLVSREKVSSHQGNAKEDVELEARS
uniref:Uncharacterized protein n=1 Tax=Tanacetum cinerariifolium TaxID=118510 RepID=A0A6L2JE50_TANCI|nr:hypothetical protein [Tanacetum cinerariifolium]